MMKKVFKLLSLTFFVAFMATIYGCKKESEIPTLTTADASGITANTAVTGGIVTSSGGTDVLARGVCWSTAHNPTMADNYTTDGNGAGDFSSNLTGLEANIQYYVRAYAINSFGRAYGNEISFTSGQALIATVTTAAINIITSTSAVSGGEILSNGGAPVVYWGICWSTLQNPDIENSWSFGMDAGGEGKLGVFTSPLSSLEPATVYYVRAFASNSAGVAYGDQLTFTTDNVDRVGPVKFNASLTYGSVTDIDGNLYKTVQIGNQTWMAENLRTTKYNDDKDIPLAIDNTAWNALTTAGYSWYNNDPVIYKEIYGALYNWYAASSNKLCPTGWHVPSDSEWTTLTTYLGGSYEAGGKMKEEGTSHWFPPNTGANNSSGLTGLPGGVRRYDGLFVNLHFLGTWWTTSEAQDPGVAISAYLNADITNLYLLDYSVMKSGASVRCVKN